MLVVELFHGFEDWTFPIEALDAPADEWRTLVDTDVAMIFATGDLASGMTVMTFRWFDAEAMRAEQPQAQIADSQWFPAGLLEGVTSFGVAPGPDRSRARWWLDPAAGDQRDRDVLHVLATDPHCAGGRATGDRLLPATVEENDDEILLSFAARRLTGAHTCPGHPPTPATVALDRPLGDRRLLDGGRWPPRPPRDA